MSLHAPAFDDVMVGDQLPSLSKEVVRDEVLAYAEASNDRNPLHLDDDFAREAGFDGMIAHGMFTMAHLTTCVTDWLRDPAALRSIRVLFRSAVAMGDTITAGGSVLSTDAATKEATLEIWVKIEREDGAADFAIRRSRAQVQLT